MIYTKLIPSELFFQNLETMSSLQKTKKLSYLYERPAPYYGVSRRLGVFSLSNIVLIRYGEVAKNGEARTWASRVLLMEII